MASQRRAGGPAARTCRRRPCVRPPCPRTTCLMPATSSRRERAAPRTRAPLPRARGALCAQPLTRARAARAPSPRSGKLGAWLPPDQAGMASAARDALTVAPAGSSAEEVERHVADLPLSKRTRGMAADDGSEPAGGPPPPPLPPLLAAMAAAGQPVLPPTLPLALSMALPPMPPMPGFPQPCAAPPGACWPAAPLGVAGGGGAWCPPHAQQLPMGSCPPGVPSLAAIWAGEAAIPNSLSPTPQSQPPQRAPLPPALPRPPPPPATFDASALPPDAPRSAGGGREWPDSEPPDPLDGAGVDARADGGGDARHLVDDLSDVRHLVDDLSDAPPPSAPPADADSAAAGAGGANERAEHDFKRWKVRANGGREEGRKKGGGGGRSAQRLRASCVRLARRPHRARSAAACARRTRSSNLPAPF